MQNHRVLAYGVLGLPLAFAALPIYVHVPRYYADVAGVELALLGAVLLGARLLDAIIDPWLGWLADNVPRRAMLVCALLPLACGFVALLNPPSHYVVAWLLGSLVLTCLGFSAATIAYQAWGAQVATDSLMRTRLAAAREGFGLVGVVLAAALPSILAAQLGDGIVRLGWIMPPLLLLAAAITFGLVPATRDPSPGSAGNDAGTGLARQPLLPSLMLVLRDAAFRRLLTVFVANGIAAALPATLFLFFVADVLGAEADGGKLLALYFIAGAASLPLWVRLAARYGRIHAWLASMLLSILAFAGAALLGPGDVTAFAVICLASGLALGADLALPAAVAADLGQRLERSGACFGVWNFAAKLNLALAAGLALPLLGLFGYVPGSAGGQAALSFSYALLPLAFKALALALLWRWRHSLEIRS